MAPPAVAAGVGLATVVVLIQIFGSPVALPTVQAIAALVALAFPLALSYVATLAVLDRSLLSAFIAELTSRS